MYDQLVDTMERDPKDLNTHTLLAFEDVYGEPQHVHSLNCNWEASKKVFNTTLNMFYIMLSTVCAIPAAFCHGLEFACLTFNAIWCDQPARKALSIWLVPIKAMYSASMRCLLDPILDAFAVCWQKARAPQVQVCKPSTVCQPQEREYVA